MSFLKVLFVGIIQAITEFLPISSSGHLNIFKNFIDLPDGLYLDIFFNTATLLSVLYVFRKNYKDFIKKIPYLFVSTLPLIIITLFFKDNIEKIFNTNNYLWLSFLITSSFLFLTKSKTPQTDQITFSKALVIGLLQVLALVPGISRSATTISTALLLGMTGSSSFQYSFFLYIPVSLGALVLLFLNTNPPMVLNYQYLISFVICTIVGIFSLRFLRQIVSQKHFWKFGFYTLALSILTFLVAH